MSVQSVQFLKLSHIQHTTPEPLFKVHTLEPSDL